ncbi:MAG: hypothetical protein U9Q69_03210 [Nanoarchaeota archaeon]|nr:hypothetical protein [Nanoarchaeota archaeon]
MKLFKRHLLPYLLSIGIGASFLGFLGYGVSLITNSHKKIIDWDAQKQKKVKKTLGVVLDKSLSEEKKQKFKDVLKKTLKKYKSDFNIEYIIKCVDIKDIPIDDIYSKQFLDYLPLKYEFYDLRMIVTDASFMEFPDAVGLYHPDEKLVKIDEFLDCAHNYVHTLCHEIAHSYGCGHINDPKCIMYPKNNSSLKFCKPTILRILSKK